MTPVAALYDVHGNLPALEAAIAAADEAGAEQIVVGGDLVLGPMPVETLERLLALGPRARFIRGNCDRLVVDAFDGRSLPPLPPAVGETIAWTARQLDRPRRDFLAMLPETLVMQIDDLGEVLFCHATPRSDDELFTPLTPGERVRPMFADVKQRTVVCGHTHMQFEREIDAIRVINAGSVGMPYGPPGAHWLLVGPGIRYTRTEYDLEGAANGVRATSYPDRAVFAQRSILNPPTEEEMLRIFEKA